MLVSWSVGLVSILLTARPSNRRQYGDKIHCLWTVLRRRKKISTKRVYRAAQNRDHSPLKINSTVHGLAGNFTKYWPMIKVLSLTFRLLVINASEIMEDITTPRENVSVLAVLGRLCEIPYTVLTNSVQRPSLLASPCNFTTHLTSGCTETVSALSSRDLQRRKSANFSTLWKRKNARPLLRKRNGDRYRDQQHGILNRQSRAERQNRTKLTVKLQIISTEHDCRM